MPHSQNCNTSRHFWPVRPPAGIRNALSFPWGLFGPPWASLRSILGLLKLFLGPSWAVLVSLSGRLGPNYQFSFNFSMFLAGFLGGSWRPLGAILGLLGPFLGPSRGHLGPCWTLLGSSWASLGPTWSHLGPAMGHIRLPLNPPWAFLVPCCAILRSLESFLGVLAACLVPSWASLGSLGSRVPLLV